LEENRAKVPNFLPVIYGIGKGQPADDHCKNDFNVDQQLLVIFHGIGIEFYEGTVYMLETIVPNLDNCS